MTTSMVLEWPGRWRGVGVGLLLALPLLPAVALLGLSLSGNDPFSCGGAAFARAVLNSAVVAVLVAGGSFCLGLPIGVLNALYEYRSRRFLLALIHDAAAGAVVPLGARLAVAPGAFRPLVAAPALRPFGLCAGVSARRGRPGLVHRGRFHGRAVRITSGGRPPCRRRRNAFSMGLSSCGGSGWSHGRAGRRPDFVGPRRRLRRWPSDGLDGDSDQLLGLLQLRPGGATMPDSRFNGTRGRLARRSPCRPPSGCRSAARQLRAARRQPFTRAWQPWPARSYSPWFCC